jgi:hypothetical protein
MEPKQAVLPRDRKVPDRNLKEALLQARGRLRAAGYAELRRVSCEADGRVLRLEGRVSRYHLKQMAQHIVGDLRDFDWVENRITVSGRLRNAS